MFDIDNHQAWTDFKAWMMWREDRERLANGLPPLEAEIAAEIAKAEVVKKELTQSYARL